MTWADTATYLGIAVVVMGGIVQMVKHFKPSIEVEQLKASITELKEQLTSFTDNKNLQIVELYQRLDGLATNEQIDDIDKQVKEMATREAKLQGGLDVERVKIETLEKRVVEIQAYIGDSINNLKDQVNRIDQNVRQDLQRLDNKMESNHKQVISLLLGKGA